MYAGMAQSLAELLSRILKKGDTLGLSWGETLKAVGDKLPFLSIGDVDVVPVTGALGKIDTGIYPSSLARLYAEKVGGTPYLINTPALVGSKAIRRSLMSDSSFLQARALWKQLGVVLLGASGVGKDSSMFRASLLSAKEMEAMQEAGAVAACNFAIFDKHGAPVNSEVSERVVKLPAAESGAGEAHGPHRRRQEQGRSRSRHPAEQGGEHPHHRRAVRRGAGRRWQGLASFQRRLRIGRGTGGGAGRAGLRRCAAAGAVGG